MRKRQITRDMIEAAREKGWSVSQTARHYGFHNSSIDAACQRFGIALPMHKYSPALRSSRAVGPQPSNEKAKAWSSSPDAIRRALAKI